jgi:glycosyltransferase involved in cell wall biosynthesis
VNILFVDLETEWRGGQNQALLLLKGLQARGHGAELVAIRGSALGERAAANGIPVHNVSRKTARISAALRIFEITRSRVFEITHANEPHAVTAAWLARAHRRSSLLIARRVGYPLGKSRVALARYRSATKIIAISNWVAERLTASGAPKEKLLVVYEGIEIPQQQSSEARRDARLRWNIPDDAPLLGSVGVLLPDKGHDLLIRALTQLQSKFPGCRLLLAGDGPCRGDLERLAKELDVREWVIFAGFVKNIETVYPALDVFLFPSFFEGLGTSLLAAMSHEIPSLAFSCCAFGEIIVDGKNGFLAKTGNVEEIVNGVTLLLRDKELARWIGEQGRARIVEKFSSERMVEETIKVYRQVCEAK